MIRAGDLKHRITIKKAETTFTDERKPIKTWSDFKTVWAEVKPLSGREYFRADMLQSEISVRVRIRYVAGISADMRVVVNGMNLEIVDVIDVDLAHRELQLMCKGV